jgi:hypothetical protein
MRRMTASLCSLDSMPIAPQIPHIRLSVSISFKLAQCTLARKVFLPGGTISERPDAWHLVIHQEIVKSLICATASTNMLGG